jgi:catechol 2,3-dioxygenase-like lactoylglutathione lyase family enzyme
VLGVDHIGVCVPRIEPSLAYYQSDLGFAWDGRTYADAHQGVRIAFVVPPGGGIRLELLEPDGAGSPLAAALRRRERLVHLCYVVPDVRQALAAIQEAGGRVVSGPTPAPAFEGRLVAFAFTRDREVLEFVEAAGTPALPGSAGKG